MKEYPKINTIFKRDMTKGGALIEGDWSVPEFEYLAENVWEYTEKVDGTNIRVMFNDGNISFGGKTDAAQIPAQLLARLNELFLPPILGKIFGDGSVTLYGEGYGTKIQNGGKYRPDQDFVLFDVLVNDWWLRRDDVENVAQLLGIDCVPWIGEGSLYYAVDKVKNGIRSAWGDFDAEGIVMRPKVELKTRSGSRIIAKIKGRDFIR